MCEPTETAQSWRRHACGCDTVQGHQSTDCTLCDPLRRWVAILAHPMRARTGTRQTRTQDPNTFRDDQTAARRTADRKRAWGIPAGLVLDTVLVCQECYFVFINTTSAPHLEAPESLCISERSSEKWEVASLFLTILGRFPVLVQAQCGHVSSAPLRC